MQYFFFLSLKNVLRYRGRKFVCTTFSVYISEFVVVFSSPLGGRQSINPISNVTTKVFNKKSSQGDGNSSFASFDKVSAVVLFYLLRIRRRKVKVGDF